jgi:hypothetical protein
MPSGLIWKLNEGKSILSRWLSPVCEW